MELIILRKKIVCVGAQSRQGGMPLQSEFRFWLKIVRRVILTFILLGLSCASTLKFPHTNFEEKDSDWRSFNDLRHTRNVSSFDLNSSVKLLWKKKVGPSYSTPLILQGMIVLGTLDEKVVFIDLNSGKKLGSLGLSAPLSLTPTIKDSILYSPGGKDDNLLALNLKNGKSIWRKKLRDLSSSPITVDGVLFVGTRRGLFFGLNSLNGEELWQFKAGDFIYSTAAFSGETLYFGSGDGKIYSLDMKTGKPFWSYKTEGSIYSSPCITDKALFLGSSDSYFYAIGRFSGEFLWKYKTEGRIHSSAARNQESIFFGSNDGYLYALSLEKGELLWRFKTDGPIHSSPLIIRGKVFFGSLDGYFYELNSSNGELVFKYKTGGMIFASPSFSEGKILIPSTNGYLYCFE
ncbi:MAG: PQQ-binding-like beta-propeller repeat protein [candidate division Zixibacteria bacterium]|nr:PQQ-binding-like beta-propeller repeat protein [candidate division Zixibacteria bacterium]